MIIEARQLSKVYRRNKWFGAAEEYSVFSDIDFTLAKGESVGLVGRSGAGKSTLGRILLGVEAPTAGTLCLQGTPVATAERFRPPSGELRRALQVVFQDPHAAVNPRLTAGEIIAEPLRNFFNLKGKLLAERIAELLVMVELDPADAGKHPARFSGGQLQRISLARALAARPSCIILDEALSSLDMLVQARLLDLLERLRQEENLAYIFISHDLRLVRSFCSRLVVLAQGRLESADLCRSTNPELQILQTAMLPRRPQAR